MLKTALQRLSKYNTARMRCRHHSPSSSLRPNPKLRNRALAAASGGAMTAVCFYSTNEENRKTNFFARWFPWMAGKQVDNNGVASSGGDKQPPTVSPHSWFYEITGCWEEDFRAMKTSPIKDAGNGFLEIHNVKTNKVTKAGKFTLESLEDMAKAVNSAPAPKDKPPIVLELILREDGASSRYVDVAYLQSLPENRNAVFQVASNFNGIEAISELSFPSFPSFVTEYINDHTQGPAASISAGGAAITRVHAAFYDPNLPPDQWTQTETRQFNFLEDVGTDHFPIQNGYVMFSSQCPPFPDQKEQEKLLQKAKIGYHKDVQVTYSHQLEIVSDPKQIIDQVFCAAVNMAQGYSGRKNNNTPGSESKCKFVLDAAYEGTYLAAIANQRKQLFLTLIGGGVFGNPPDIVFEALLKAHQKWGMHNNSTIEKVTLVLYTTGFARRTESFVSALQASKVNYRIISYKQGRPTITSSSAPSKL